MSKFEDGYWWSNDGLRLHFRDYSGDPARPPIICIPGLTRNARDFGPVADVLAGGNRLICVELRGRGESAHAKDAMSYVPLTYWQDVEALIAELGLSRFIMMGTSLGGLVTMLTAAHGKERLAGAILNDIGPDIDPAGLSRIKGYVGKSGSWLTWMHAARALAELNAGVYPDYAIPEWLAMAKRLYRVTSAGRIVQDYDARIAEPFRVPGGEAPADLWPLFSALEDVPTLVMRGALSDILSDVTAKAMKAKLNKCKIVTVPRVGHTPVLDEPAALTAIKAFLKPLTA